ncbi:hypothetical protein C5B95_12215 [Rathayibacter sp. AY1A7]|nr:hypothetical protein C5B95_12215 [Rathayibacter sp. AY1A7]
MQMMMWRETASAEAQEDLDGLLDLTMTRAVEALGKRGELGPFSASIDTDGRSVLSTVEPAPGQGNNSSQADLDELRRASRENRQSLRAVAYVSVVTISGSGDAIRVESEHREGIALVVLVPYTRLRLRKQLKLGEMRLQAGVADIWAPKV